MRTFDVSACSRLGRYRQEALALAGHRVCARIATCGTVGIGVLSLHRFPNHRCIVAKSRAKKVEPKSEVPTPMNEQLDPKAVHELFGLPGPYDSPAPPIPTNGYRTWWDPGCSIQTLVKKHRELFYLGQFPERFAKDTDSWKWRMIRLEPIEPGLTFADQEKKLATGDKPAAARELVTFLVLHFLTTGERIEMCRWRCNDVMNSGRRVTVGPFGVATTRK